MNDLMDCVDTRLYIWKLVFKNGKQNLAKEKTFASLLAKKGFFIGERLP